MKHVARNRGIPGSIGCQPVGSGSLPKRNLGTEVRLQSILENGKGVVGKLPTTAGWQPAIPGEVAE